jgi:hypothetical protein
MRKTLLSLATITTLSLTSANATSQSEIEQLKAQMNEMSKKIEALERQDSAKLNQKFEKSTVVKSKLPLLKFSGKHYIGFVSSDNKGEKFETRRNYLQVKGYFNEEAKDYFRITLDTHQITDSYFKDEDGNSFGKDTYGTWNVRLKYAYLYLDEILPYTGVEIGQAHRPWIDYEEHGGWNYRSISKVMVEESNAGHLTNSADLGINFKTKTEYFSSELGIFNGEGYHNIEDGDGLSAEWRFTGHIFGGGTYKRKNSSTYADVSFFGQMNADSNKHKNEDLDWYGVHAVYNQPEFLISAQYVATEDANVNYAGEGYSINGEFRLMEDWNIIGRFDSWEMDEDALTKERTIAGVAYKYNKYVEFIVNYLGTELGDEYSDDAFMLTAEVNW